MRQGQRPERPALPTPVGGGQATGTFEVDNPYNFYFSLNPVITANVTDSDGNTSEFSQCFNYTDDTVFADGFGN